MNDLLATPPDSKGKNGRPLVTPKHRKRSPGDALGSGKSQVPITRFYSPVSSSTDLSQPYSPIPSGSGVKRRISEDFKHRKKRFKTETVSQNHPTVVLTSDDSSDDVFTQDQRTNHISPVPNSRLNFPVKKRIYPVTSSPIPSTSAQTRKKRTFKSVPKEHLRRSRILSDSESEDEVPMENSHWDSKPRHTVPPSSQAVSIRRSSETRSSKLLQTRTKPSGSLARKRLCLETSSQAVVISNSDDSDFELHNSKQSHSFLSRSLCDKDAKPSCQKSFLSSQANRTSNATFGESSSVGDCFNGIQKSLKKRCSSASASLVSKGEGHGGIQRGNSRRSVDHKSQCSDVDVKDDDLPESSAPAENGCVSSIYLQDTLSPPVSKGASLKLDTDETDLLDRKTQLDTAVKPGQLGETYQDTTHSSSLQDAVTRAPSPFNPGRSSGKMPVSSVNVSGNADSINDGDDDDTQSSDIFKNSYEASSIYLQDTVPLGHTHGTPICTEATENDNPDGCRARSSTGHQTPGHPARTVCQSPVDSPSCQEAVTQYPPPGHSIYHEETIDPEMNLEATLDLDSTDDFCHQPLTNCERNNNASAKSFAPSLPACLSKGTIVEPSDEEDESMTMQDKSDCMQVAINRTSFGAIPLSELLSVSHISGSDDSDFSDIVQSDDEVAVIDRSVEMFPEAFDNLATRMDSLVVENADDSSDGITSVMNSVLDASADFFSDVISSLGTGESSKELEDGQKSENRDCLEPSPTTGIVKIALSVAGLEESSGSENLVHRESLRANDSDGRLQRSSAVDSLETGVDCHKPDDGKAIVGLTESSPCKESFRQSLDMSGSNSVMVVAAEESGFASKSGEASTVLQNGETAVSSLPPPCSTLPADPVTAVAASSVLVEEPMEMPETCGVPSEIKVVCGVQPPEDLAKISSLRISHNVEPTLIHNLNRPLLLDTVISECQNYAEHVLNQEPIKTFALQYSCLPKTSKISLHGCLLELLDDSNRWLKYNESSTGSIDTLVTSGIFEYLNKNDELTTKLNHLTFPELTDVLCKLGNSPSKSIETMKNIILNKFSSAYTCERVKKEVIDQINRKFIKLTESAAFCIKICLELFALPLNICDKLYKTVDVARYANALIRDLNSNKLLLLPLKTSKMVVDPGRVLRDLGDLCRLKSAVFGSDLKDESIFNRVNDICSSIVVLEFSGEKNPSVRESPTFRFLMANYVHALDEQLKSLVYCNSSDIDFGACVYLGVLLKQNVTGAQLKVKWCRDRMKHLSKLLDSSNVFEEFSKILKEPVSPVEFIVRSEFVSSSLKIKKLGLSPDEKSHLTKLLRPITHKKTRLAFLPLNSYLNHYSVLTKKPKGKNINSIRANIFENYKSYFPCGVEDNGSLLLNAIYLTFWQAIYMKFDGMFVLKYQNCPIDWGSEEFFSKRRKCIENLASEMRKHGLPAVFKLIKYIFEQFFTHRSVIDWQLVAPNMTEIQDILEALGIEKFLKICIHVLSRVEERVLGFPDIVLWNPETRALKFLGLRKPADPLYPHQILWLEKLAEFGVDAEELLVSGCTVPAPCSQLK